MIKKTFLFCFLFLVVDCLDTTRIPIEYDDDDGRSRVWTRIPENGINHKIYRYLAEQDITNCYEFREQPRLLRLRCLSYNQLFDVDIIVYPGAYQKMIETETHNKSKKFSIEYQTPIWL